MQGKQPPGVRRGAADEERTRHVRDEGAERAERGRKTEIERDVASVQNILIKPHNKP